jgi:uncharacterized protein YhhL (DUF1145 family)
MDYYSMYLLILLAVKLAFVYFIIKDKITPTEKNLTMLENTDKLFTVLMSLLLVYLFHPGHKTDVRIDHETKLFLFLFGLLMFIDIMKEERTQLKKSHV